LNFFEWWGRESFPKNTRLPSSHTR
jgi:hypothetical protein